MVRANSVTAFDAKNRLGSLLDRVAGGEELTITRHGQPVARLVPINKHTDDDVTQAFETFRRIRESMTKSGTKISRDEIKKWRAEGRR